MADADPKPFKYFVCEGTYVQLRELFKKEKINTVFVKNISVDKLWPEGGEQPRGANLTYVINHRAWHRFKDEEQAAKFAFETNGKTFHGSRLQTFGMFIVESSSLENIMALMQHQLMAKNLIGSVTVDFEFAKE